MRILHKADATWKNGTGRPTTPPPRRRPPPKPGVRKPQQTYESKITADTNTWSGASNIGLVFTIIMIDNGFVLSVNDIRRGQASRNYKLNSILKVYEKLQSFGVTKEEILNAYKD